MRSATISVPILALALSACAAAAPSAPPPALGLDPFYTKHVSAQGIPVVASARVPDKALHAARDMIAGMLAHRPDLAHWLGAEGYRVSIMAESETITDLPENAHWTKPAPDDPRLTRCEKIHYEERIGRLDDRTYWDGRVRGIGGPRTAAAEEDVLGYPGGRYWGETILVHEFAHNVLYAIEAVDSSLYARVEAAFAAALAQGRWKDEYASTSLHEYWAEGTQFWFDSNRLAVFGGRRILDHADLAAYDPALYAALGEAYGTGHALRSDPFRLSAARIPPGPIPENTAEIC